MCTGLDGQFSCGCFHHITERLPLQLYKLENKKATKDTWQSYLDRAAYYLVLGNLPVSASTTAPTSSSSSSSSSSHLVMLPPVVVVPPAPVPFIVGMSDSSSSGSSSSSDSTSSGSQSIIPVSQMHSPSYYENEDASTTRAGSTTTTSTTRAGSVPMDTADTMEFKDPRDPKCAQYEKEEEERRQRQRQPNAQVESTLTRDDEQPTQIQTDSSSSSSSSDSSSSGSGSTMMMYDTTPPRQMEPPIPDTAETKSSLAVQAAAAEAESNAAVSTQQPSLPMSQPEQFLVPDSQPSLPLSVGDQSQSTQSQSVPLSVDDQQDNSSSSSSSSNTSNLKDQWKELTTKLYSDQSMRKFYKQQVDLKTVPYNSADRCAKMKRKNMIEKFVTANIAPPAPSPSRAAPKSARK